MNTSESINNKKISRFVECFYNKHFNTELNSNKLKNNKFINKDDLKQKHYKLFDILNSMAVNSDFKHTFKLFEYDYKKKKGKLDMMGKNFFKDVHIMIFNSAAIDSMTNGVDIAAGKILIEGYKSLLKINKAKDIVTANNQPMVKMDKFFNDKKLFTFVGDDEDSEFRDVNTINGSFLKQQEFQDKCKNYIFLQNYINDVDLNFVEDKVDFKNFTFAGGLCYTNNVPTTEVKNANELVEDLPNILKAKKTIDHSDESRFKIECDAIHEDFKYQHHYSSDATNQRSFEDKDIDMTTLLNEKVSDDDDHDIIRDTDFKTFINDDIVLNENTSTSDKTKKPNQKFISLEDNGLLLRLVGDEDNDDEDKILVETDLVFFLINKMI